MTQVTEAYDWRGRDIIDVDGDKVGTLEELFRDEDTEQPEWAAVRTGFFGTKLSFVPLQGAEPAGEQVRVQFAKDQIKDAPKIDDSNGELSQAEESELYSHYGLSYGERRSDSGLPEDGNGSVGHDTSREGIVRRKYPFSKFQPTAAAQLHSLFGAPNCFQQSPWN